MVLDEGAIFGVRLLAVLFRFDRILDGDGDWTFRAGGFGESILDMHICHSNGDQFELNHGEHGGHGEQKQSTTAPTEQSEKIKAATE